MVITYIILGLGIMVAVPLVSAFLFLMGFGGIVNAMARNEVEDDGDD